MNLKHLRTLGTISLSVGIILSQSHSTAVDASTKTFQQQISQDEYQKTIAKGFLGRAYGTGGGRYVCNTYVEKALESLHTTTPTTAAGFKNIQIQKPHKGKKSVPTSYDWFAYQVKISYTPGSRDDATNTYQWEEPVTNATVSHRNKGTSLDSLSLGDVLVYGSGGGHVALYFGEFEDISDVASRLVELGVYKKKELKRSGKRYLNKSGKTVIREYSGSGTKWRIHATCSGLMIDNAIVSKSSNGTSSFGRWNKTIESGFTVYNEIIAE